MDKVVHFEIPSDDKARATPIPGMGAFARVSDPEGNVIGLFQAG